MTENPLRVIFMGTPAFAVPALATLMETDHDVVGVFTQPDRRSGRGRRLAAPPVKEFAQQRELPVFQPASLREDAAARRRIDDLAPDAIIVTAYGLFLPDDTLAAPRLGCLNIHPSLLPRHRGPSPVATAILNGDDTTGVTIMLLDEGMDTGPVLAQRESPMGIKDTSDKLTTRLFDMGANLLVETLEQWRAGHISPTPQDDANATITKRLQRADGHIDWNQPAKSIDRQVRAFTPWPGTFTTWKGRTLKILEAEPLDTTHHDPIGKVVAMNGSEVATATGQGVLRLLSVQMEGRRASNIADFIRGYPDFISSILGD
ncbi:MAG: methionyl-tRNA formyltransferase [Dehalococcoidia bacterium]|nr:methionyl-tRNA formyltransferase [Dehalococcoidia bacterium]